MAKIRYDDQGNILPTNLFWVKTKYYLRVRTHETDGVKRIPVKDMDDAVFTLRKLRKENPDEQYYATIGIATPHYRIRIKGRSWSAHSFTEAVEKLILAMASPKVVG